LETNLERNAKAVIHVLSLGAIKLCLVNPGNEVKITDSKMIKVRRKYYNIVF